MLADINFIGGNRPVDPGYGVSAPGLPPGAAQLPVFPFDPTCPDNSLPGSQPGVDNSLPGGQGGQVDNGLPVPGKRYVVKWLACHGLILVPDNSLPGASGRPDNTLPGSQPKPDQGLPQPPIRPDQGLPPTAQPKK
jgi:hypothetical protein